MGGFALAEVGLERAAGAWFWATHGGAELDLLVITPSERGYVLNERTRVMPLAEALAEGA